MTISEKVAYLKGLADGLDLQEKPSKEGKLIAKIIGLLVHKVVQVAVVVAVLHVLLLHIRILKLGRGVKGGLGHSAGDDILHLGAHESSALSGLYVLEFHDLHNLAVHLKGNAIPKFAGRNHSSSSSKQNCRIGVPPTADILGRPPLGDPPAKRQTAPLLFHKRSLFYNTFLIFAREFPLPRGFPGDFLSISPFSALRRLPQGPEIGPLHP